MRKLAAAIIVLVLSLFTYATPAISADRPSTEQIVQWIQEDLAVYGSYSSSIRNARGDITSIRIANNIAGAKGCTIYFETTHETATNRSAVDFSRIGHITIERESPTWTKAGDSYKFGSLEVRHGATLWRITLSAKRKSDKPVRIFKGSGLKQDKELGGPRLHSSLDSYEIFVTDRDIAHRMKWDFEDIVANCHGKKDGKKDGKKE